MQEQAEGPAWLPFVDSLRQSQPRQVNCTQLAVLVCARPPQCAQVCRPYLRNVVTLWLFAWPLLTSSSSSIARRLV